jgi:hypothetical protein
MKTKIIFLALTTLAIAALESCTKAGTGGNATVICNVSNGINNDKLSNITVYIKYGQSTAPSQNTSGYDDHKQAVGTKATFTGLKQGTYYFLITAYDSAVSKTSQLSGSGPFSLTHANRNGTSTANFSVSY